MKCKYCGHYLKQAKFFEVDNSCHFIYLHTKNQKRKGKNFCKAYIKYGSEMALCECSKPEPVSLFRSPCGEQAKAQGAKK